MVAETTGMYVFPFPLQLNLTHVATVVGQASSLKAGEASGGVQELQGYIAAVASGDPGTQVLQKLALLCLENPITEPPSPPPSPGLGLPISPSPFISPSWPLPSLHGEMWDANKNFDRLFSALVEFLDPAKASPTVSLTI